MKSIKPAIFTSFKGYNLSCFFKDLMSGVLVAIIALPLSIALGIQSGATLQQGIITAFVAGFIISAFGGSAVQIGGPTAAFVSIIVGYINTEGIGILGVTMATIMAGVIMILLGIFRVGGLVKYIPYPIVIGFTSGIGVTLLVGQLADLTGIKTSGVNLFTNVPAFLESGFINKLADLGTNISTFSFASFAIGLLTLALLIILPKINKKIPSAFVAIVVTTCITCIIGIFDKNKYGIATIGSLYDVKAEFYIPNFAQVPQLNFAKLILPAIVIAFLGSVESLLSATVADNLTGKKHDSNAELIGEGLANITSGLVGGLPATGAIARTAANIQNGGTSPVAGMIHAVMLALMFFVLMPVVKFVPMASLAAVLIMVSYNMANFKLFAKLTRFTKTDLAILLVTFCLTIYKDLVYGVIGGLTITIIFMAKDIFVKNKIEVLEPPQEGEALKTKIIIPHRNLTFINYTKVIDHCVDNLDVYANIIIDFSHINRVDVSSLEKLKTCKKSLERKNKTLSFINANERINLHLARINEI